jgi:hypothetical protein
MNPAETIINFLEFLAKKSHKVLGEDLQDLAELGESLKQLSNEQLDPVADVVNKWIRRNPHIRQAMSPIRESPHDSGLRERLRDNSYL